MTIGRHFRGGKMKEVYSQKHTLEKSMLKYLFE